MADAEKYTEEQLAAMEAHIRKIYTDADEGIRKAWDEYMRKASANVADLQKAYDAAKASGDKDAIRKAGKELGIAQRQQTVDSRYYQNMVNATTYQLANVNQTALAYVNGQLPNIYSTNYNAIATESPIKGYAYDLVDASTVKHLATTDDSLLPTKSLNVPKDQAWNTKSINSQVLQGILQGESIDKIAGRLENVVGMNTKSAIRNARTMTTSAQNKGRQDSYDKAVSDGVVMQKVWIATPDERVRAWHMALHHVAVDVDKSWSNEYGDIEYPGDPHASPGNVYNCRCTMKTKIIGFRGKDGTIYNVDGTTTEPEVKSTVVQGKDISRTWTRRADQFDFAIDDIVEAQGFNGLPTVVSDAEFAEYASRGNVVMMRGYTAPNAETLSAYQESLRTGSWYIDCSEGACAYGQGMYVGINAGSSPTRDTVYTALTYAQGSNGAIEVMTMREGYTSITTSELVAKKDEIRADAMAYITEHGWNADSVVEAEKINKLSKMDDGQLAALLGYDAIVVDNGIDKYAVVLNRTALVVRESKPAADIVREMLPILQGE